MSRPARPRWHCLDLDWRGRVGRRSGGSKGGGAPLGGDAPPELFRSPDTWFRQCQSLDLDWRGRVGRRSGGFERGRSPLGRRRAVGAWDLERPLGARQQRYALLSQAPPERFERPTPGSGSVRASISTGGAESAVVPGVRKGAEPPWEETRRRRLGPRAPFGRETATLCVAVPSAPGAIRTPDTWFRQCQSLDLDWRGRVGRRPGGSKGGGAPLGGDAP